MNTDNTTTPTLDLDRLAALAKDAAYIAVGFGVLGVQKAQVRRRELTEQFGTPLAEGRDRLLAAARFVTTNAAGIDRQVQAVEARLDGVVETLAAKLPAPADAVAAKVHGAVKVARAQVRERILATV